MNYCKRCADITMSRATIEFRVVIPPRNEVLKRFDDFYQARTWANSCSPTARVVEYVVGYKCLTCGKEK